MAEAIRVMGICGTFSTDSANGRLLEIAFKHCESMGAECVKWDNSNPLPFVGEEGCWDDESVKSFQNTALSSDAFILSSPEYHGTMSGVMKNSLDFLSYDQTSGKSFALMSTLGGQSNSNTLNHMRISVRWIHGWAIPEQIAVGNVRSAFDENGDLIDEKLNLRIRDMVRSLIDSAEYLRSKR